MNLLNLVLLAIAAAFYPTLLAGVLIILGRPAPLRMLVGFLLGGLAISIAAGLAIAEALRTSNALGPPHSNAHPIVDVAVGSLSLVLAWGIGTGRLHGGLLRRLRARHLRRESSGPSFTERALGGDSMVMAGLAGLLLSLPGIWYLDALAGVAHSRSSTAVAVLEILLFNVIMFALVELPIVGYLIDPAETRALVGRLQGTARTHARTLAVVLAAAAGVWLIAKGVTQLAS